MQQMSKLLTAALIVALLSLASCKGVAPSAYQQEMEDRFGGVHGGGY